MKNESVWVIMVFNGIYFYTLEEGAYTSKKICSNHIVKNIIPRRFIEQAKDIYSYDYEEHDSHGASLEWRDHFSSKYIVACELDIERK